MAKVKEGPALKEPKTSSTGNFSRSFIFNQEEFQRFEEKARRFNVSPGVMFRKVVSDYLNDRYINVDELDPQIVSTLEAYVQKSGLRKLQNAVNFILEEWVKEKGKRTK